MKRFLNDRRGVAALEMALITSCLLLPITAGLIGTGEALIERYRLDRGLHAALIFAWGAPPPTSAAQATTFNTNVASAAQSGYGTIGQPLVASATLACYCIHPTDTRAAGTPVVCYTGTCSVAGTAMGQWVTISMSTTFIEVFNTPWSAGILPLSTAATVRVQ